MPTWLIFIIRNLGTIETIVTAFLSLFPEKTVAAKLGNDLKTHPDAAAALQKIASDYENLNK